MTTDDQVENFINFCNQLEKLTQHTSEEAKKRIHYKTLSNYIYHYNSSKKGKTRATELLKDYLKLIEVEGYMFSEQQSKDTYDAYIRPLAQEYYTRYVNFSAAFAIIFEFVIFIVPVYLSWMIFHSKITMSLLISLYVIHYIDYFLKYRNKKIYGYRY